MRHYVNLSYTALKWSQLQPHVLGTKRSLLCIAILNMLLLPRSGPREMESRSTQDNWRVSQSPLGKRDELLTVYLAYDYRST